MANTLFAQQMPFIFVPGGPANVQVIFQDHLGRLWVGGAEDVACFDGSRFYSLRDLGFPAATGTTAITEDRDGAIWIGSDLGVYRFYRGSVTKVMPGYVRGSRCFFRCCAGVGRACRARLAARIISLSNSLERESLGVRKDHGTVMAQLVLSGPDRGTADSIHRWMARDPH